MEVLLHANQVINNLIELIRDYLPSLYNVVECISFLDFLTSLAYYSSTVPTGTFLDFVDLT